MRRFLFAVAAGLAIMVAAAALPTRAGAMTVTAPAGLAAAITETSATEQVYWRHRCWGCWHRHHWWGWHRPWWPLRPWGWHRRHYWGWGWHWRRHYHRWWW
jgi:hypothetical protein